MALWNLDDFYKKEEKEQKIKEYLSSVEKFIRCKEELNESLSPKRFIQLLEDYENLNVQANILSSRISLQAVEDITNEEYRKEEQEMDALLTQEGNKCIFFMHFFKELSNEKAQTIISQAGNYTYFLTRARRAKPHTRTEAEEQIINLKDLSGESTLIDLRNILIGKMRFPFKGKDLLEPEIVAKRMSEDPQERIEAYQSSLQVYKQNEDLLGEIYKGVCLDWYNETTQIRKHKSSISSRNFSNTIPDEVVDIMLEVVQENISLFQEYFKLKANILGCENSRHHLYAPYILKDKKEYSYDYCKEKTLDVYKQFSEETYLLAKNIFDANHVHSEVIANKRPGAFCFSYKKDAIPYILLNHMNRLDDFQTMAHEFGHGIHGQLAKDKTEFTFHSSIGLAEVASIFGELLLTQHLLNDASEEEKKYLLFHTMDRYYATIARQAYYALFEKKAHEQIKKGTTVQELHTTFHNLHKEQFGAEMNLPDEFAHEWLLMPHIFNSPFYVYSYAFANLIVLALFNAYKREEKSVFVSKYLDILRAGGDSDVVDIMRNAGFDITKKEFWESSFEEVKNSLEELKQLIK
jgi:oligoendopeptidase F